MGVVTANNGANVTVKGCTFRGNAGTKCVDVGFNVATGSSMAVDDCLFADNILTGNGVTYVASGVTSASIQNCTFTNNAVTASAAAVVYCSGTTTIAGNLFVDNSVTATGKEGVIVLGSGATGTVVGGNAFVDNELGNAASHYATLYTGSNCNLAGNYWGEGAAPEVEDHADVYASGELAIDTSTFASAYAVNDDGCGVTVTIYVDPVATVTIGGVTTPYADLHEALVAGKASGSVVTLVKDVDLDGVAWAPVAGFAGTFDGNNKTVSNLTINDNTLDNAGLFSRTGYGAVIKNLTIESPTVVGRNVVGALASELWASAVTNCHVTGDIVITGYHCVGGLAGQASYTDIDDCSVLVNAASAIESSKVSVAKGSTSTAGAIGAACAANSTEVPAGAKNPEIKAIKIAGGNVYITVGGTMPFMQYDIIGGTSPEAVTEHANSPLTGKEGGDIILVTPAKGTSGFYRVGRN